MRISSRDPEPPPLAYVRVSGGIFLDMTIHDFDMARFVTGSDVAEVYADGAVRIEPSFAEVGDIDTAVVTLRHENGCLTVIDNSRRSAYGFDQRVEVFGAKGYGRLGEPGGAHGRGAHDGGHAAAARCPTSSSSATRCRTSASGRPSSTRCDGARLPPVTGIDGRAPLVIGLAARRSLRERRPVRVAEIEAA